MLREISIKNFAIINDVTIELDGGLSVLTGETGAGKSIIIEAVNLILGGRASADLVRSGARQAELSAWFDIDSGSNAAKTLESQGSDPSEGLMVRRVVSSSGKSQVFVNSQRTTVEFLKKVTLNLAGISSQHAHQGLLKAENHLEILDQFAQLAELKKQVRQIYQTIVPLRKKRNDLFDRLVEREKEQELLQFQIQEIESAQLQENEDEILEKKRSLLLNAAQIFEAAQGAIHEINDRDGSLVERIGVVQQRFEKYAPDDAHLSEISRRCSAVLFDLEDIAGELRNYTDAIDLDPASLDAAQERMDLISKLKRKYGPGLEQVFEAHADMTAQLSDTDDIRNQIQATEARVEALSSELLEKVQTLSMNRKKAAESLSKKATHELASLEMARAGFSVAFSTVPADHRIDICDKQGNRIGPDGIDRVHFLLRPNPGEPAKPLSKTASGGELSRIVLALKAVLSVGQSLETLIFDEVDAGIGGATSEKVGLKLRQLARRHQVLCITHLAQIAKYGDSQFHISKQVENDRTFTTIVPLEQGDARIREIARMIAGKEITDATLAHARELLMQSSS